MELGGAERALLGLLGALDPIRVQVDLFLNQHTGAFMPMIPDWINLLPERKGYRAIEIPMKDALKKGELGVLKGRLKARRLSVRYRNSLPKELRALDISGLHRTMTCVEPYLESLEDLGEYDLAISFLQPHNFTLNKVKARRKIAWIHTDYSVVHVDVKEELPVWSAFDYIASISPDCTTAFLKFFPDLANKIIEIENILPKALVEKQAMENEALELKGKSGIQLVSVGRICYQKQFDILPVVSKYLINAGLDFTWTVVGPGNAESIVTEAKRLGVSERIQFIGGKSNPYPYIAAADIYLQPSRYEGKCVAVREAQMLQRPVIITNYPTASSQIIHDEDGIICPMNAEGIAEAILKLASDKQKQERLKSYLSIHDYSNMCEVEKLYSII